ncbi:MAG: S8 family serine peptidase [Bacteroidales bacterium]|nr:S8 family serine peptidase [Bacteroidales bacterium]
MKKVFFTLFFTLFLCVFSNAQNIEVIETELQNVLNQKSNDLIDVNIYFKSQINAKQLSQKTKRVADKSIKREIVVSELKGLSEEIQSDVLSVLKAEELNGNVAEINCLWIANSINCKATRDVIYKLSSHPDIKALGYNKEIQVISPEEVKEVSSAEIEKSRATAAHHILTINADDVWSQGYTGKNVVVAVLDSGTNYEHKDIESNLWEGEVDGQLVNGWNFIADNSDISDDNGHGTHCAGIVCGNGTSGTSTGVAPDAKLMTVKIVGGAGTGTPADMLSGVQFAVENGANILSMSLGFKKTQLTVAQIETIRSTFDNVLKAGVIVCAAAGNDGNSWGAPKNVDYPAACPAPWSNPDQTLKGGLSSVVCVGGSDLIGSSSQGPSTWEDTKYNDYPYNEGASMGLIRPDISAPGNLLYSLNHLQSDKYRMLSGTSQSTPVVAGVMALMLEKNSTLTPAQISEIIETTAASKPATKNNVVGAGRVDALAAVNAVAEGTKVPYIKFESVAPQVITQGDGKAITVKVKNVGKGSSAAATSATLSLANDEYVTISTPTVTLGQISAGNTKDAEFTLNVNSQTPNGHVANFTLDITSGDFAWKYPLSVKIISTPDVVFSSVTPGSINVNQDVNINVTMKNNGTAAMNGNTELTLSALSGDLKYITIVDNSATVGSMEVGGTSTGSFTIRADKETPHNYRVDFFMETYSKSEEATNLVYEFENDNEGWTSFAVTNNVAEPWWHSTKALEHSKKGKDSHSGKGHLMSETVGYSSVQYASPIDNYLVSPTKVLATRNTEVSFYARAHHATYYPEHFGLAVSTSGNSSANDFTMLQDWTITKQQGTSWNKYTVNLGAYAGQEIYVAIRHFFTSEEWADPAKADEGLGVDALNIDDVLFTNVMMDNHSVPTYSGDDKNMFSIYVYNMKELAAVKNLVATAKGETSITLTWDAVEDAQSYNIYRDGAKVANVKTNSYEDSNLTHNTTYNYTVAAVYSNVEFEHSNEASATTQQIQYSAALKNFTQDVVYIDGETSVDFNFTILNDGANQFKARAYYTLTCDNGTYVTITNKATDALKALASGEEVTKTVNVKFSENTPNKSVINFNLNILSMVTDPTQADYFTFDLPFSVTIKNDIKAPKGLVVTAKSENSVTLKWNQTTNAISYNVYRNGAFVGYTSSTSYFDNGLEPATEYYYEVTSVSETGESEKSERLVVTTSAGSSNIVLQSFNLEKPVGETTLTATLINNGNAATPSVTNAILKCADQYVTILDGTYNLGSIAAGGTATATFRIQISNDAPLNHNLNFDVDVEYESDGTGGVQTLTYTFDNDLNGWTTINANRDEHTWYHSSIADQHQMDANNQHQSNSSYSPSGGGHIISESYCNATYQSITPNDFIVSPMQVEPTESTTFEFYARSKSSGYKYAGEHFGVFVSTSGNATLGENDFETKDGWEWTFPTTAPTAKSGQRGGDTRGDVVTIDGTVGDYVKAGSSNYVPINTKYAYSTSQQIYLAEELNGLTNGSKITSVAFNVKTIGTTYTRKIKIYMANITADRFDATTKKPFLMNESDLVYEGTIVMSATGWYTLNLNEEFEYTGNNVLLCVYDCTGTAGSGNVTFSAYRPNKRDDSNTLILRQLYKYAGLAYDPTLQSTAETTFTCPNVTSSTGYNSLSWVQFTFVTDGDGGDTPVDPEPEPVKPTISVNKTQFTADNSDYVTFTVTPDDAEIWYTTGTQNAVQLTTNDKSFKTSTAGKYSFYAKKDGVTSDAIEVEAVAPVVEITTDALKWTRYSVDLESYKGQKIWIAIRHFNCEDNMAMAIDDITISNVNFSSLVTNTSSFSVSVNPSINTFGGSGAWNVASNWSKGSVPTETEDIIIDGNATIESGSIVAKSITINSGSLTINSGATLTVNGLFLNANPKAFIINDGAQVFQNNDNVVATYNMLIDRPMSWGNDHQGGWQFISSPITNAKIDGFKPESETDYDLFKYDGTQELQWINHKNHGTDFETTFQQGRGYIVSYEAETTAEFEGIINNARTFSFTDVKAFDAENHYNNFYLLGNPFMFNMDWTNMTVSDVYNGYATISNVDGSYDYHTSGTINVGDGFMVKSTGFNPELTYNHNVRTRIEKHESLDISASNIYGSDNVIINLAGQEEEGFTKLDNLNENIAEIYVENAGTKYGIFSFDEDVNEVKLGFRAAKPGTHIIRVNADGNFEYVTLVDNITGKEVNMLEGEYAFTVYSTEEGKGRFSIKFCKKATSEENFVYQSGDELIIEGDGLVQIIDVMGRVVYNNELNGTSRINVGHLNEAVYIVRRVNGNDIKTQKVLVF